MRLYKLTAARLENINVPACNKLGPMWICYYWEKKEKQFRFLAHSSQLFVRNCTDFKQVSTLMRSNWLVPTATSSPYVRKVQVSSGIENLWAWHLQELACLTGHKLQCDLVAAQGLFGCCQWCPTGQMRGKGSRKGWMTDPLSPFLGSRDWIFGRSLFKPCETRICTFCALKLLLYLK